jgi:hypothetical protein
MVHPQLHRLVNVLLASNARLERDDSLVEVRHEEAVRNEAVHGRGREGCGGKEAQGNAVSDVRGELIWE